MAATTEVRRDLLLDLYERFGVEALSIKTVATTCGFTPAVASDMFATLVHEGYVRELAPEEFDAEFADADREDTAYALTDAGRAALA